MILRPLLRASTSCAVTNVTRNLWQLQGFPYRVLMVERGPEDRRIEFFARELRLAFADFPLRMRMCPSFAATPHLSTVAAPGRKPGDDQSRDRPLGKWAASFQLRG
jgi:hypothetical protein